ncbi:uncharacterized protein FIESC28_03338 [Fusarium coffeatum]|uniref:Uncharacterized protein n=1 Tax=Fusarium coffeatum TaxID=231269 RepID=A0A366S3J3_9HYPO|nr:uncharacterized protein FIESC28_03338 [Fusarium coffeatum]RBR23869.1 hypothetical protein FIESC28_03338 [Fusarium coffeatum]
MFMRNVFVAAVSLQALVDGVAAREQVTLTKYVTKAKAKPTAAAENNLYPVPDLPEPEVTVRPTSYIEDGTTIFVDETVTIPCSRCTASTAGNADAEATSEVEVVSTVITTDAEDGDVSDQTAEVTVVPTSYITDGTTIFVDETITIPCTKCAGGKKTETGAAAEETSEAAVETEDVTTGGDALAEGTSSEAAASETLSTDVAEATETEEQTADITKVVPTSYITEGTTRFVDVTVTIPCTKCAGGKKTETAPAGADETVPAVEESTSAAGQEGSSALGVATSEAEAATSEAEAPVLTSIIPSVILTTGNSQETVISQPGPFANTTMTVPAGAADTTAVEELPATSEAAATSSAVVSEIKKPVIVVIREVTIFHRTIVIGAACPPVKRGTKGDFVVGTGTEEKSFPKIDEALDDACAKQAKACSESAGKNYEVSDCQKQLEICRSDASSTAKAPTGEMKESTETATVVLPSDAAVTTGSDNKPNVGGHVVISTRTLTVSESCVVSDGTPVIETPASTEVGATTVQTADAETTEAAFETTEGEVVGSTALGVETSEAPEMVTTVTMTKPNGEVSVTSMTLTNGVPTGTGATVPVVEETTAVEVPVEETTAVEIPAETSEGVVVGSTAAGVETSEVPEVPESSGLVTTVTMTKPNGEVSTTALTLTNGVPTGTGTAVYPGFTETKVESDAETEVPVETMPVAETSAPAEVSSALGVETSEEATTVVTGTQTGVVVITMTKPNGEVSVTSMTLTTGVPSGTGALTVPAEETTVVEAPAETSEAPAGETTAVDGSVTTIYKEVTKTVTNQVTNYVTVGVNTQTVGEETITKTLTSEVTQTVTVGGGEEIITKTLTSEVTQTVTVGGGDCDQAAETVTSMVTMDCEAATANVVTQLVTMCPSAQTTMAVSTSKEPETVYVTATVEAQNKKPKATAYPVPERLRRAFGLW